MWHSTAACCNVPKIIHRLASANTPRAEEGRVLTETSRIDLDIEEERKRQKKVMRLLLLGPSETGKSTIVKQMRILHAHGFSHDEQSVTKYLIYNELVRSVVVLTEAYLSSGGSFSEPEHSAQLETLRSALRAPVRDDIYEMKQCLVAAMTFLINDSGFNEYITEFGHANVDASSYFLDTIGRITSSGFVPCDTDFLHLRIPTTGIVEITFQLKSFEFRVLDVGGQKTERRKWLHAFENVNAVIFMSALSDFNLTMRDDPDKNRFADTLDLFNKIYGALWFLNSSFMLFYNKKDLLAEKLKTILLKDFQPSYEGDNSFEDAADYLESLFRESAAENPMSNRQLYTHRTCATDTNQMELVLDNCIDIVLEENMKRTGLS